MGLKDIIEPLVERLNSGASVKAVYGEPIEAQGKTIIPVAKVGYGFGAGFGKKAEGQDRPDEGGGIGVGLGARPVGVIEITGEDTRFIPCGSGKKLAAFLVLGFVAGFIIARR